MRRPRDVVSAREPQGFSDGSSASSSRPTSTRARKETSTTKRWVLHRRRDRSFAFRRHSSRRTYHRYRLAASLRGGGIARARKQNSRENDQGFILGHTIRTVDTFDSCSTSFCFYYIVNNDFSPSFSKAQVNYTSDVDAFRRRSRVTRRRIDDAEPRRNARER